MAAPLTRADQKGRLYTRPGPVEAALDGALALDEDALLARAKLPAGHSQSFPPEVLVHVTRHAFRAKRRRQGAVLFEALIRRASELFDRRWGSQLVRDDTLAELGRLLAEDAAGTNPTVLDAFERNFRNSLYRLRISEVRKETRGEKAFLRERGPRQAPVSDDKHDDLGDAETLAGHVAVHQIGDIERHALADRILALPEDERTAFVLVHVKGYPIEPNDPTEESAASICGVSGRTIRTRLKRALDKLNVKEETP